MEGDDLTYAKMSNSGNFYPRPHMEGDRARPGCDVLQPLISTHALTWRATYRPDCKPR